MIESPRKTQIISLLDSQRLLGFWEGGGGDGDEVQKIFLQGSVEGKIVWNLLWEHRFSVQDPRVFPPPGDRFSAQTTENQIYKRACSERGSWVIMKSKARFPYDRWTFFFSAIVAIIWKPGLKDK